MPPLSELYLQIRNELIKRGVELDDGDIELVYNEIAKREATLVQTTNFRLAIANDPINFEFVKRKNERKCEGVNSRVIFKFTKILTGSLLCMVPVPIVQRAGALLLGNGINDCIDGAREQGDANEQNRNRLLIKLCC